MKKHTTLPKDVQEDIWDDEVEIPPLPATINVMVRSLIEAKLQYYGSVSGKLYEWSKAGQAVPVLDEDVPELLAKQRGKKRCCGESNKKIFELVQEAEYA